MEKQTFNHGRFFWGYHPYTDLITEPVKNKSGARVVEVYAKSPLMARALIAIIDARYSIKRLERCKLDKSHFRILY